MLDEMLRIVVKPRLAPTVPVHLMTDAAPRNGWIHRRQNPVPERGPSELEADLQSIVDHFGEGWLGKDDGHPIQHLWARQDSQATTELLTLGDALRQLAPTFSGIAKAVKTIKRDPGERKGFMFELLMLRFFLAAGRPVKPTGRNHPGFDLTFDLPSGPLDLSLKNFTRSVQERELRKHWKAFKVAYLRARETDYPAASGLRVIADRWATPEEWRALTSAIGSIKDLPMDGGPRRGPEPFVLVKHALPTAETFHDKAVSYHLQTFVPHHLNEERNLIGKLEEAIKNAETHAAPDRRAGLMVRLRETADLDRYRAWAQAYLDGHPESSLALIALYQPAWIRTAENSSQLHHGLEVAFAPAHRGRLAADGGLSMVVPIGVTGGASRPIARDGEREIALSEAYVLQEGRFHLRFQSDAWLTSFAPYVETVAYQEVLGEEIAIIAVRPTTEDFELLD